ncbi:IclR family transcriptional regulator [Candidatus Poriferisocius sp.]|uniref:IclR family transcriptional regulator n=1 Tax=Candidatus Poriferisocius sp. TaxID=3101276 RepID=UPI003B5BEBC8
MAVQSVKRAFLLLRTLSQGPLGVTDLAERVDLPKSTVARLLAALEAENAVEQVEVGGDYRIGAGLTEIAGTGPAGRSLVAAARPHLLELSEAVGEVAGLSIIDDNQVYYLDHTESSSDVQLRDWTGEYAPLHAVPSGMAMLAHLPAATRKAHLAQPLEQCTPWTTVDPQVLAERLQQIRSLGYVWGYEEFAEGISSVAAPVLDPEGHPLAALHVHGPAYRFPDPDEAHDHGLAVVAAAHRLAAQLTP